MSVLYFTVSNNTAPTLSITLERNGTVINLAGATVNLYIRQEDTTTVLNLGHTSATITSASGGVISYTPQSGDFPSAGRYQAEAKISFNDGTTERMYEVVTIVARDTF